MSRENKESVTLYLRDEDYALVEKFAEMDCRNATSFVRKLLLDVAAAGIAEQEPVAKKKRQKITVWDDPEVIATLKTIKETTGLSISSALRIALAEYQPARKEQ